MPKVECLVCGESYAEITASHLKKHKMSRWEYDKLSEPEDAPVEEAVPEEEVPPVEEVSPVEMAPPAPLPVSKKPKVAMQQPVVRAAKPSARVAIFAKGLNCFECGKEGTKLFTKIGPRAYCSTCARNY